MKKLNAATLFTITTFMSGCSTINYNTGAKTELFSEPPVGDVVEAYVGDYMLDQGKSTTMEYLTITHLIDGIAYDILPGSYARIGDFEGIPYFSATNVNGQSVRYTAGLIDPPIALHTKKQNEVCVTSVSYQAASCYDGQLKVEERTITDNQSFQQTLIYNGSVGKKINISYREFSNGSARNAFTNNVEYDMSKSNIINYKGAQIEVLGYDNSSIKFKVLKHFRSDYTVNM
ncbi:hypothetical protein L4174_014030 [Photobacterium sp. CCB-ST2H9]|uniref:hypothetical protein n=1 Tax=Photobacterium sp. CCB-ST2H9 TaxID=2912855 RepID=UPI002002EAC2|nr:hypothetical protein [Photobacterium sp. CCB-ST2H9]UTM56916.1 hypothetical protein L4174_014030 [Photobacterium sp. CCB-ST2H9]